MLKYDDLEPNTPYMAILKNGSCHDFELKAYDQNMHLPYSNSGKGFLIVDFLKEVDFYVPLEIYETPLAKALYNV